MEPFAATCEAAGDGTGCSWDAGFVYGGTCKGQCKSEHFDIAAIICAVMVVLPVFIIGMAQHAVPPPPATVLQAAAPQAAPIATPSVYDTVRVRHSAATQAAPRAISSGRVLQAAAATQAVADEHEWDAANVAAITGLGLEEASNLLHAVGGDMGVVVSLYLDGDQMLAHGNDFTSAIEEMQFYTDFSDAVTLAAVDHVQARSGHETRNTCCICYEDDAQGLVCQSSTCHFVCSSCAPKEVQRTLQELHEPSGAQLARHRARGGAVQCVQPECSALYDEQALARILPPDIFSAYRAAQHEVVEQRLFTQLQTRFQNDIALVRATFGRESSTSRGEHDAQATAEFMQRQYPHAVQCPQCGAGPVIPENCPNLETHHGQASGRGRISNACPSCQFFSRERSAWVPWDGKMR